MGLFSTKTADVSLSMQEFAGLVHKDPNYQVFKADVGDTAATHFTAALHDKLSKMMGNANAGVPLKLTPGLADMNMVVGFIDRALKAEVAGIKSRKDHLKGLADLAGRGALGLQLSANAQPEKDYYTSPAPLGGENAQQWSAKSVQDKIKSWSNLTPAVNAEANVAKAKAWLKAGVKDDTQAYDRVVQAYARKDGAWPFGTDETILRQIWNELVKDAPVYRIVPDNKYPSDFAGMVLLREQMAKLGKQRMPPRGSPRWEDVALHLFGVIMSLQAFPDGNKRVARAAYAILMAGSGVDFRAPNKKLGGELAAM